eukprot:GHVU01218686.1.p1 GENE.GHVU01218686.1~~GHVU01218686.1.p1  ORF type:complete len:547 (+),score=115.44 GHVU01218686.1:1949-3589(+)
MEFGNEKAKSLAVELRYRMEGLGPPPPQLLCSDNPNKSGLREVRPRTEGGEGDGGCTDGVVGLMMDTMLGGGIMTTSATNTTGTAASSCNGDAQGPVGARAMDEEAEADGAGAVAGEAGVSASKDGESNSVTGPGDEAEGEHLALQPEEGQIGSDEGEGAQVSDIEMEGTAVEEEDDETMRGAEVTEEGVEERAGDLEEDGEEEAEAEALVPSSDVPLSASQPHQESHMLPPVADPTATGADAGVHSDGNESLCERESVDCANTEATEGIRWAKEDTTQEGEQKNDDGGAGDDDGSDGAVEGEEGAAGGVIVETEQGLEGEDGSPAMSPPSPSAPHVLTSSTMGPSKDDSAALPCSVNGNSGDDALQDEAVTQDGENAISGDSLVKESDYEIVGTELGLGECSGNGGNGDDDHRPTLQESQAAGEAAGAASAVGETVTGEEATIDGVEHDSSLATVPVSLGVVADDVSATVAGPDMCSNEEVQTAAASTSGETELQQHAEKSNAIDGSPEAAEGSPNAPLGGGQPPVAADAPRSRDRKRSRKSRKR